MKPEDELNAIAEVLDGYEGDTVLEMAEAAVAEVAWLKDELVLAQQQAHALRRGAQEVQAQMQQIREREDLQR